MIKERIDEIIEKRKTYIPNIKAKQNNIEAALSVVNELKKLKAEVMDENNNLLSTSKYYSMFMSSKEAYAALAMFDSTEFEVKVNEVLNQYSDLENRFSREYINIAVVGPARQGKSRFLQSISGLDDRCIPALSGGHCTGARSTIENSDSENVCVEITFKNEKEILNEIQGYVDNMTNSNVTLRSLSEVSRLTNEQVNDWINSFLPERERFLAEESKGLLINRYVNHYNEWIGYIGKSNEVLYDENLIMEFVSQHNDEMKFTSDSQPNPKYLEYYKFVAVKSARIMKKFKHEDCGKIKMIDTVGLGSIENGVEDEMINAIKNQSDGAVLFFRPEANVIGTADYTYQNICNRLHKEFFDKKTEKWFSYVINHTLANEAANLSDNMNNCVVAQENAKNGNFKFQSVEIVDSSNTEDVKEYLHNYVSSLSDNLKEIDMIYVQEAVEASKELLRIYSTLCNKLLKIISAKSSIGNQADVQIRFENLFNSFTQICSNLNMNYSKIKDDACDILITQCQEIYAQIIDEYPSADDVREYFANNGVVSPHDVYMHFLDELRDKITQRFIVIDVSLEKLINDLKNEYAKIFIHNARLEKIVPFSDEQEYQWLSKFAEFLDENEYPQIKFAFEFLSGFSFGVRGFMMYRVRKILSDISRSNTNILSNVEFGNDVYKSISFDIRLIAHKISEALEEELKDFFTAPNETLYAISDEFFDRILYSKGVQEQWRRLYLDETNLMRVWENEIKDEIKAQTAMSEWLNLLDEMKNYNMEECFTLSI